MLVDFLLKLVVVLGRKPPKFGKNLLHRLSIHVVTNVTVNCGDQGRQRPVWQVQGATKTACKRSAIRRSTSAVRRDRRGASAVVRLRHICLWLRLRLLSLPMTTCCSLPVIKGCCPAPVTTTNASAICRTDSSSPDAA